MLIRDDHDGNHFDFYLEFDRADQSLVCFWSYNFWNLFGLGYQDDCGGLEVPALFGRLRSWSFATVHRHYPNFFIHSLNDEKMKDLILQQVFILCD